MRIVHPLLLSAALALAGQTAFAQTQPTIPGAMAPAPDAAPAPGVTPAPQRITATTTDPLVQKRISNADANAQYKDQKKAAKRRYKMASKKAATNRKLAHVDAENTAKEDTTPTAAPMPGTGQAQH